jgi:AcrR family transcriptional regulator
MSSGAGEAPADAPRTAAAPSSAGGASRPRRGRPSTGARERILAAAIETLKAEGYAGLTLAKVAARAGEGKALVSYHFGSKQGLVAAAARELARTITAEVIAEIAGARTPEEILRRSLDAVWGILERDPRLPRAYFDLNAVSVVEDDVRATLRAVKAQWREVLAERLRAAGVGPDATAPATVLALATIEGFCLEWIERGDTRELAEARELFARNLASALGRG